jgi:hypothetical protein
VKSAASACSGLVQHLLLLLEALAQMLLLLHRLLVQQLVLIFQETPAASGSLA